MPFNGKSRFLVVLWLMSLFIIPGLDYVYSKFPADAEFYWYDIVHFYYYYSLLALGLYCCGYFYKVNWLGMFKEVVWKEYIVAFKLTIFVFIFSIAAAYLLFYPLSFIFPEFVEYWYLSESPLIYLGANRVLLLENLLSLVALIVLPPIIEEYIFRGYLLHRFAAKWNLRTGVIMSSLIFGLLHSDPVGAIVFGIAMCVIYLRTQSLFVPIICHAFNNFLAWLWELQYVLTNDSMIVPQTIDEFRADWELSFFAGLVTIVWIVIYLRKPVSSQKLTLPELGIVKA